MKQIGRLCHRLDPKIPRCLTEEQKRRAHSQPKVREKLEEMRRDQYHLRDYLISRFDTLAAGAHTDQAMKHKQVTERIQYLMKKAEMQLFRKILEDFHNTADLNDMVSQLENENFITDMLPEPHFILEERQRLATSLFQPSTETSFSQIVEDLSMLCTPCVEPEAPRMNRSREIPPLSWEILKQRTTLIPRVQRH